jgi:SpoVK/Ycf46/Vps4 family AAA+-type ATPase
VLITGAPGVGKTMTARYLATELSLPLYTIDLAGLISSYLGRTGQNLRQALDYARRSPSVLLIDEFDALAKRRDDQSDVGELKRIVNVLLLELEQWPNDGMLIAATNHPELLDRAIWRRFDKSITIGLPDIVAREAILQHAFERVSRSVGPTEGAVCLADVVSFAAMAFEDWTPADLVRWSEETLRVAILTCQPISETMLARVRDAVARSIPGLLGDARVRFAQRAAKEFGWSQREIARLLDVSHTAVSKWIAKPSGRWPK